MHCILKSKPYVNLPVKAALMLGPLHDASLHYSFSCVQLQVLTYAFPLLPKIGHAESCPSLPSLRSQQAERHSCILAQNKVNEKEVALHFFFFSWLSF